MVIINIPKDFSTTPGSRKKSQGPFSAEEFREKFLNGAFDSNEKIQIIFDGALGYPPSFLEETFGQLTRDNSKFTEQKIFERFDFISKNDPRIIEDVRRYILEARKR